MLLLVLCFKGDLVYFDTEGDYFIQGRIKDLIKYKGYQVIVVM